MRGTVESAPLTLLRYWLAPVILVATLLLSLWLGGLRHSATYAVLAVSALFVSRQLMSPLEFSPTLRSALSPGRLLRQLAEWSGTALIVLALAVALKAFGSGSTRVVAAWICATPITLLLGGTLGQKVARRLPIALRRRSWGPGSELIQRPSAAHGSNAVEISVVAWVMSLCTGHFCATCSSSSRCAAVRFPLNASVVPSR